MSVFGILRRILVLAAMTAIAVWCALRWSAPLALAVWAGLAAALCVFGAVLMSRQPVGVPTVSGQLGASVLPWGYKVGRGRLPAIVLVSWLIWTVVGAAAIAVSASRGEPETQWMILAWTVDGLALLYLIGVLASNTRGARAALLIPIAAVLFMIGASAFLWQTGSGSARGTALLIGGAPIPILAAGYGLMLGAMMLGGRKGGWK